MGLFSSPITGAAVPAHLTSPTYTLTQTSFPDTNGRKYIVSAVGGTQTGVSVHSVDSPFYLTYSWPKVFKTINAGILGLVGYSRNLPVNKFTFKVVKGGSINAGGGIGELNADANIYVPVGMSSFGPAEIAAAMSALAGALSQGAAEILASATTGVNPA